MDDSDRTAVRDHQDLLAWMEAEHVCEEVIHAGEEVLEGLGVVCPRALARDPSSVSVAEAFLYLRRGEPFPGPEAAFPQPWIDLHRQADVRHDDLRGLPRSGQIARIDS